MLEALFLKYFTYFRVVIYIYIYTHIYIYFMFLRVSCYNDETKTTLIVINFAWFCYTCCFVLQTFFVMPRNTGPVTAGVVLTVCIDVATAAIAVVAVAVDILAVPAVLAAAVIVVGLIAVVCCCCYCCWCGY